ncbi:hypothetical protein Tco_0659291 [Tanacetum coccineum]
MLLTPLFDRVMSENPELLNDSYVLYDRVMYPLTAQQERKTRKDYGTKRGRPSTSASSSSAFGQPSSSHHIDDDNDGNNKGTSRASTPFPTRFVNSLSNDIPQSAITELVYFIEPHDHLNPVSALNVTALGESMTV